MNKMSLWKSLIFLTISFYVFHKYSSSSLRLILLIYFATTIYGSFFFLKSFWKKHNIPGLWRVLVEMTMLDPHQDVIGYGTACVREEFNFENLFLALLFTSSLGRAGPRQHALCESPWLGSQGFPTCCGGKGACKLSWSNSSCAS